MSSDPSVIESGLEALTSLAVLELRVSGLRCGVWVLALRCLQPWRPSASSEHIYCATTS